jgi:hypothetical protein
LLVAKEKIMDRLSSHEVAPTWSISHFNSGRTARLAGADRDAAPAIADVGQFAHKSWLAGWHDAEMGILASTEIALESGALNQSAELNLGDLPDPLDSLSYTD